MSLTPMRSNSAHHLPNCAHREKNRLDSISAVDLMNRKRHTHHRSWYLAFLVIATTWSVMWTAVQAKTSDSADFRQLPQLAENGQFDRVLAVLQSDPHSAQDGRIASLIEDLERYKQNAARRDAERQEAYEEAFKTMAEFAEKNQLEKALASAIDAHDLATEPDAMLEDPQIQDLMTQARAAAAKAEANNDWIEALTLYRELDLLFNDFGTYRDQSQTCQSTPACVAALCSRTIKAAVRCTCRAIG